MAYTSGRSSTYIKDLNLYFHILQQRTLIFQTQKTVKDGKFSINFSETCSKTAKKIETSINQEESLESHIQETSLQNNNPKNVFLKQINKSTNYQAGQNQSNPFHPSQQQPEKKKNQFYNLRTICRLKYNLIYKQITTHHRKKIP